VKARAPQKKVMRLRSQALAGGRVDHDEVRRLEPPLREQGFGAALHTRLEQGHDAATAHEEALDRVEGARQDPALGSEQQQHVDVVGYLRECRTHQTANGVALGLQARHEAGEPELAAVLRIAFALAAQHRDHAGLHREQAIQRGVDRTLVGALDPLEVVPLTQHEHVRGADAVHVHLFRDVVDVVLRVADVGVALDLLGQQPRAPDAWIERVVEEQQVEGALDLRQQLPHRLRELEALLEGPIEPDFAARRESLRAHREEQRERDPQQAPQQDRPRVLSADEAQLTRAQNDRGGEREASTHEIHAAERAEVIRGVEGAEPEGHGDEAEQPELAHQAPTRRRSKEKRAIAIATRARPAK
jgi:hypothetical protein